MASEMHQQATRDVVSLLPSRTDDMAPLAILLEHDEPIVSVIGKYKHGKRRLLNESIGLGSVAVETVARANSAARFAPLLSIVTVSGSPF